MRLFLIPLVLFLTSISAFAQDFADSLIIARKENAADQVVAERLLRDIMQRANLGMTVRVMPSPAATQLTLSGDIDGEPARVYSYGIKYPELVRVQPPYYYLVTAAFGLKERKFKLSTIEDLNDYKVGVVLGIQHAMDITAGHPRVTLVASTKELYALLAKKKIDIAIDTEIDGMYNVTAMKNKSIVRKAVFSKSSLFLYLNKDKEHYAQQLSNAITGLTKTGELSTLQEKYEREVLELAKEHENSKK